MAMFDREQLYNDVGLPRTKALFYEFGKNKDTILSLNNHNKEYPSLRMLYVSLCTEDPSEYTFADTVFGDIQFWERLKQATWMKEHLQMWRHEADLKRKSMAFREIINEVKEGGRSSYQAARYLVEEPWRKGTAERKKVEKSSSAAVSSVRHDLNRLKEEGLIQ